MAMCGASIKSLTGNSATSATSSKVVDDGRIALNSAISRKIASIACVGDVAVLKNHDGSLHSVGG